MLKTGTIHSILGLQPPVGVTFSSLDDVLAYFKDCFLTMTKSNNGVLKFDASPLLKVDIPLDIQMKPDMLRVQLPTGLSGQKRTDSVLEDLQRGQCVFVAAVSGAGKTRLAFDVAQKAFALYFDMNGGHGKVAQQDVQLFMQDCQSLNTKNGPFLEEKQKEKEKGSEEMLRQSVEADFEHLIGSLFLARWITLFAAKRQFNDLTPAEWLWMQTDNDKLSAACYKKCVALPTGSIRDLLSLLCSHTDKAPLVELDEAQQLLGFENWFRSKRNPDEMRPLGYAMVEFLVQKRLVCLASGTNLRLIDFHAIRSAAGISEGSWRMHYEFDYLDQAAVRQLIEHFLDVSKVDGLDNVLGLLQGRPRFAVSAISRFLVGHFGDPVRAILSYTETMLHAQEEGSIYSIWKTLYRSRFTVNLPGSGPWTVWALAFDMLTQSLFCHGQDDENPVLGRVNFPLNEHREVVSHGVSMITTIHGYPKEVMAEPLVLSAGITFCLNQAETLDIAKSLLEKLHDVTTDAQHRGKLLKFLVAARIWEKPNRLSQVSDWPTTLQLPDHRPQGILVGVPLTDPRLKFAQLDQTPDWNTPYYLGLIENHAGPDLVGPRMLLSLKSSGEEVVSLEESKKSIKTTTPSHLYTKADGSCYTEGAWRALHAAVAKDVAKWKAPIMRVRVELPKCSSGTTPAKTFSTDGKWHCGLNDVDNSTRGKDIMLYISAENLEHFFGFKWK